MKKMLSPLFFQNLKEIIGNKIESKKHKTILEVADWESVATHCFESLINFFKNIDRSRLDSHGIETIGVVDICWNEYGSNIEVDFMPDNNFEEAFDEGCIMNDSAIDNRDFFSKYFDVPGEEAWGEIGDDYLAIITIFFHLTEEIIEKVVEHEAFKSLPKKSPCHIGFAGFHDEERTLIHTIS